MCKSGKPQKDNRLSIVESVKNEIAAPSIDISLEYTEIGLDAFLQEGILKDIPLIRTAYGVWKIASSISTAYYLQKLFVFLKECQLQIANDEKREHYKKLLNSEEGNKILKYSLVFIEKFEFEWKAILLARLLEQYISRKIDWKDYYSISAILESLTISDFNLFKLLREKDNPNGVAVEEVIYKMNIDPYLLLGSVERLVGFGVIEKKPETYESSLDRRKTKCTLTRIGAMIYIELGCDELLKKYL